MNEDTAQRLRTICEMVVDAHHGGIDSIKWAVLLDAAIFYLDDMNKGDDNAGSN